ncbi:helicase containing protein [Burkholderia sp. lig30]|uniref:GIY-YIG nuclease family protein n=1 Tax=Burkholderia sp. lig30 TaxID=1192124 RepID=UPI000461FCE3|nr:GIY-YIG nuclease family protein [Burkholderia sp. lig30]KDB09908.1 helicase containing protein [Burkholderia sp. lig30]
MKTTTHLYILIFPEKNAIKIGKANDIQNRIDSLKRWWGAVDHPSSYYLKIDEKLVYKLEKTIHFMLSHYSIEFDDGDGKSEMFSFEALEHAIGIINLYTSMSRLNESLKKGIKQPLQATPAKTKAKIEKYKQIKKKSDRFFNSLSKSLAIHKKIHRLIIFLIRHQARIQFQYDIVDDYVFFRVRNTRKTDRSKSLSPTSLFSFDIDDFDMRAGINLCSAVGSGNIVQYKIQLIHKSNRDRDSAIPHLSYMSSQVERLLDNLPKKSESALEDIPILDERKIINEIINKIDEA